MANKLSVGILLLLFIGFDETTSQNIYFPPVTGNYWETVTPISLGWNVSKIQSFYDFNEQQNSKAIIVLKNGRIVLEKYFGSFTKDSLWYWASAGKTITAFLIGKAQEDGLLKISDLSSKYLGTGWTTCPREQENKITIRHQLTMTTGLDDGLPDNHCTFDSCLMYKAEPGTRWAYHNAPYTLLEKVLTAATKMPVNTYTQQKLSSKTGINGLWYTINYDNVFFSKPRNMARFGLLFQNNGVWGTDTLLKDKKYYDDIVNTSQPLNYSYGYLWWLNGKESFMAPTLQLVFPGSYAPDAPKDMFAGLGKNGQIVCVSKSSGIVLVRMGDRPNDGSEVPFKLCNQIWQKLNEIMNIPSSVNGSCSAGFHVYPNPARNAIYVQVQPGTDRRYEIRDNVGKSLQSGTLRDNVIDISNLPAGLYFVQFGNFSEKFMVVR